jgi:short-chain fatty acids transporter
MKNKLSFGQFIPSPFSLAILLSFATFILALFYTSNPDPSRPYIFTLLGFWEKGFWELLTFAMQMMLMLVLGNVLALTPAFNRLIDYLLRFARSTASAVVLVSIISLLLAYLNWGLSLILSALLAERIGNLARKRHIELNYPLVGAAAYSGLMVWHGGFSGSAPLKVAEKGHFLYDTIGQISPAETILSPLNLWVMAATLVLIPLMFYLMSRRKSGHYDLSRISFDKAQHLKIIDKSASGAERLDYYRWFSMALGLLMLVAVLLHFWQNPDLSALNINTINLILFAFSLLLYPNLKSFTTSVSKAISNSTGIMLQFPLYAGIMGLMKYSGLTMVFTQFFIQISTAETFPLYAMISAGIVNFFVPSGGGQWAVQGPVLVEAAHNLGVSIPKTIMALAYGDELTNMLQPFWALPLLGITKLKAREILPYSAVLMLLGFVIYAAALIIF